jgi:hypothetical protein
MKPLIEKEILKSQECYKFTIFKPVSVNQKELLLLWRDYISGTAATNSPTVHPPDDT